MLHKSSIVEAPHEPVMIRPLSTKDSTKQKQTTFGSGHAYDTNIGVFLNNIRSGAMTPTTVQRIYTLGDAKHPRNVKNEEIIIRVGVLKKTGPNGGRWLARHCILLSSGKLLYFTSNKFKKHAGTVQFHSVQKCSTFANSTSVFSIDELNPCRFNVTTPSRTWQFEATSEQDAIFWAQAIAATSSDSSIENIILKYDVQCETRPLGIVFRGTGPKSRSARVIAYKEKETRRGRTARRGFGLHMRSRSVGFFDRVDESKEEEEVPRRHRGRSSSFDGDQKETTGTKLTVSSNSYGNNVLIGSKIISINDQEIEEATALDDIMDALSTADLPLRIGMSATSNEFAAHPGRIGWLYRWNRRLISSTATLDRVYCVLLPSIVLLCFTDEECDNLVVSFSLSGWRCHTEQVSAEEIGAAANVNTTPGRSFHLAVDNKRMTFSCETAVERALWIASLESRSKQLAWLKMRYGDLDWENFIVGGEDIAKISRGPSQVQQRDDADDEKALELDDSEVDETPRDAIFHRVVDYRSSDLIGNLVSADEDLSAVEEPSLIEARTRGLTGYNL